MLWTAGGSLWQHCAPFEWVLYSRSGARTLHREVPCSTDWRYTRQMAKITTRSEEVEQRTRCGEVVQRGKGLWFHPAPVGRGRVCSFLSDSDGWLQIADGGTNGGVRGQTGAERLPSRERHRSLEA